ncbi:MAG TPA: FkbM family methyltransferase [Pseudonocardiaceae bacterium]|nr:FkbM family methyltransferase [Pseudonocardiaceae bacterium]
MLVQQRRLPNGRNVFSINRNETDYLYKEIFEDQAYINPGAAELSERPVIFDIGANIGLFAIFAAERWPGSHIVCFEPVPEVFDVLRRNIADIPGAAARNVAVGASRETREIVYYPRYTILSGFDAEAGADRATVEQYLRNVANGIDDEETRDVVLGSMDEMLADRFEQTTVAVQLERLTDAVADLGVARIDLLKVDVEGSEVQVLQGMDDAVWQMVGSAVIEIADNAGELDMAAALCHDHGMRTEIRQLPEFGGTNLHVLFAER